MRQPLHQLIRDLHLYLGLFVSPFVVLFAVSVLFLVHGWTPAARGSAEVRTARLTLPAGIDKLPPREQIDALRGPLARAGVQGELGFVQHHEQRLVFTVSVPGSQRTVDVDLFSGDATIHSRATGLGDALITLHKFPGQHLAAIRMNWPYMRAWLWLADSTVYLVMFLSVSGIYLWALLGAERRAGLVLLAAGAITFFGLVYGVCH